MKRIVSLLPSATEILLLIEQEAHSMGILRPCSGSYNPLSSVSLSTLSLIEPYNGMLVGRSHECDYPTNISHLPVLTRSRITNTTDSLTIHQEVIQSLHEHTTLYEISNTLIESLRPDIILTQDLCDVCSIDSPTVERLVYGMNPRPEVVILESVSLNGVLESIVQVGVAINQIDAAIAVKRRLQERLDYAITIASNHSVSNSNTTNGNIDIKKKRIEFLEWLHPIFPGGHWTAEMLVLAGGHMQLNLPQDISKQISYDKIISVDPEYLIIAPCGFSLDITIKEMEKFIIDNHWWLKDLSCYKQRRICLVDGNQHFNRPGPRLIDAFEFLVGWLHDVPTMIPKDFPYVNLHELIDMKIKSIYNPSIVAADIVGGDGSEMVGTKDVKVAVTGESEGESTTNENYIADNAYGDHSGDDDDDDDDDDAVEEEEEEEGGSKGNVVASKKVIKIDKACTLVDIEACHLKACSEKQTFYEDPSNGLFVMTEYSLLTRGICCGNGCRYMIADNDDDDNNDDGDDVEHLSYALVNMLD